MLDFENDVETKIDLSDEKVRLISSLAQTQLAYERRLKELAEITKSVTDDLRKVQEIDLPDAMLQAGVTEIKLTTGETVSTKADIYPSIPKPKVPQAYAWLRNNGHGSIIKNIVSVPFSRGEDERAKQLLRDLMDNGYEPEQKQSIHAGTLKSFVKEYVADPDTPDLPDELFTVFEVTKSVIKTS